MLIRGQSLYDYEFVNIVRIVDPYIKLIKLINNVHSYPSYPFMLPFNFQISKKC
jgi:hypothetical protein